MSENPFPGPQPYRAAQRTRFFREDAARKLANQVMACRVTTVHGPSGAGKSSLLQAAVLPALEESDRVRVVKIDGWPADVAPLPRLMRAMATEFGLESVPEDENPAEQFAKVVELSAQQANDRPILLYLDQFEQLFITNHADDEMKALLSSLASLLERERDEDVHVILSLREDYLGRLGDWARARPELVLQKFRVGPLSVGEMVQAMCRTAKEGESSQEWNADEIRALMLDVRVPGQHATDAAEVQAAFGQIVCRALWEERAAKRMTEVRGSNAEAMMHWYLDATLAGLGSFQGRARELLEQHLIDDEGRRRLLTEQEVHAVLGSGANDVVGKLEQSAILHAEARQGKRYFELGHDWLAKKVLERRVNRAARAKTKRRTLIAIATIAVTLSISVAMGGLSWWALEQRQLAFEQRQLADEQRQLADEQRKSAWIMNGSRELLASDQSSLAALVAVNVDKPELFRGWKQLAMDTILKPLGPRSIRRHPTAVREAVWSADSSHFVTIAGNVAYVWRADGTGKSIELEGHKDQIESASFSPDGTHIVTASKDKTARIWRADGMGDAVVLEAHSAAIVSASFSPNGQHVVTASEDTTARVWRVDKRGEPVVLEGHDGIVNSASFSPDGARVVTASTDHTARVWQADNHGDPVVFEGHDGIVNSASFSPDGRWIVTASQDKTVRVRRADGEGVPLVQTHQGAVKSALFSRDGSRVLTVSEDPQPPPDPWNPAIPRTVRILQVAEKNSALVWMPSLLSYFFGVSSRGVASISPDGRYLAIAPNDNTARVLRADDSGDPVELEPGIVWASFSPDGQWIVTVSPDKTARVWRTNGEGDVTVLKHHPTGIVPWSSSPDGQHLVGAAENDVMVWRTDGTGQPIVLKGHIKKVWSVSFSPDGQRIVSASEDGTARVWRSDGTGVATVLRGHDRAVASASFSPDGQRVVTGSWDTTARVWHADREEAPIAVLKGHSAGVTSVSFSPDGQRIVTGSFDRTARVFRADGTSNAIEFSDHENYVLSVSFSPDGAYIVTGSQDMSARVWRADGTGRPFVFRGHKAPVRSARFSLDSQYIVTASSDNTAHVWRIDENGEPLVLHGHGNWVLSAAFLPDGQRVVTTSADGTARIWPINIPLLQQALRNKTSDCLTPAQRQTYLLENESDARTRYEQCERSYDRTPLANP